MHIKPLLQFICTTLTLISLSSIPTQAITAEEFDKALQNSIASYSDTNSNCSFLYCESAGGYNQIQNQLDSLINTTFDPSSINSLINQPLAAAFQDPECKFELARTNLSVTKVENLGSLGNGSSDYLVSGLVYNPCPSKLSQKIYINYEQNAGRIQPIESMLSIPKELDQNNPQFRYFSPDLSQISNYSIKINVLDSERSSSLCISFDQFCNQQPQPYYSSYYSGNNSYQSSYQNYLPSVGFSLPSVYETNYSEF